MTFEELKQENILNKKQIKILFIKKVKFFKKLNATIINVSNVAGEIKGNDVLFDSKGDEVVIRCENFKPSKQGLLAKQISIMSREASWVIDGKCAGMKAGEFLTSPTKMVFTKYNIIIENMSLFEELKINFTYEPIPIIVKDENLAFGILQITSPKTGELLILETKRQYFGKINLDLITPMLPLINVITVKIDVGTKA